MPHYTVEFWGDVEVEAATEAEALRIALDQVQTEPTNTLFWEVEDTTQDAQEPVA